MCVDTGGRMKKITVMLITLLLFLSLTPFPASAQAPEISSLRVSNPSSSSVTISWVVSSPSLGRVDYGLSQAYGETAYDNNSRMNGVVMVTITGLAKETTYYYMVTAVNNKGENTVTGTFKTAKEGLGQLYSAYGQILCMDGSPASSTVVYVTVEHQGAESLPLSDMTSSEGYWSLDLGNLKDKNGGVYQWYNGDNMKIEAQGGTLGYGCKQGTIGLHSYYSQIFLGTPQPEKEQTIWDKISEYKLLFIGASAVIILIGIVFAARKKIPKTRRVKKTPAEFSEEPDLFKDYTFDRFVIGDSNKFAADAALTVAKKPGSVYNPLLIYADVGIGKTHLLNAIGNYVREYYPEKNVKYISSEKLIYEFTVSGKDRTMEEKLRKVYRNVDILLVDDIQFLAGKPEAQEEFFHTFNTLFLKKKQIVFACDRPPKDIPSLDDRLRSRFEGGLVTHILDPEIETRIIILKRDAEKEGMKIDFEVLYYISSECNSNIRNAKGGLTRVMAYAKIHSEEITIDLVKKVLGEPESVEMKFR